MDHPQQRCLQARPRPDAVLRRLPSLLWRTVLLEDSLGCGSIVEVVIDRSRTDAIAIRRSEVKAMDTCGDIIFAVTGGRDQQRRLHGGLLAAEIKNRVGAWPESVVTGAAVHRALPFDS